MKLKTARPTPRIVVPADLKHGDRLHVGPDRSAVVRRVWHTENWTYTEVDGLYFTLRVEPHSTVTVDR